MVLEILARVLHKKETKETRIGEEEGKIAGNMILHIAALKDSTKKLSLELLREWGKGAESKTDTQKSTGLCTQALS